MSCVQEMLHMQLHLGIHLLFLIIKGFHSFFGQIFNNFVSTVSHFNVIT